MNDNEMNKDERDRILGDSIMALAAAKNIIEQGASPHELKLCVFALENIVDNLHSVFISQDGGTKE